jgi:hypothetical protein
MSLMSMQLWALVDLAGPVFTILRGYRPNPVPEECVGLMATTLNRDKPHNSRDRASNHPDEPWLQHRCRWSQLRLAEHIRTARGALR